jgi:hypothetical protein
MVTNIATPEKVAQAPYSSWWFTPAWRQMHCSNAGNNIGVVSGANGSGKSYMLGWVGETLGVNKQGETTLFNPDYLWEHMAFDAKSFSAIVKDLMKLKKCRSVGYQILIEESQLSLYNKDFGSESVKDISRLLMTVRSRRWGVYMNIPSMMMLNKDVRTVTNWNVEMRGKPTEYSYGTYYDIMMNPHYNEPYKKKPVFTKNDISIDGRPLLKSKTYPTLSFPSPSRKFIRNYEKMKEEHQQNLYTLYDDKLWAKDEEEKEKSKTKNEIYEEMALTALDQKERIFDDKGKIVTAKIASLLGITRGVAGVVRQRIEEKL